MQDGINMTKKKSFFGEFDVMLFLLVMTLLVLSAPMVARFLFHQGILIGEDSYYNLRMGEYIIKNTLPSEEGTVYDSGHYIFNPYHLVFAGASYLMGGMTASRILPFVLGFMSSLLFYLILRRLGASLGVRLLSSLLFILSPVFIHGFNTSSPHSLSVFLILLGFYLFINNSRLSFILSILVFSITPFFGIFYAAFIVMALLAYAVHSRKIDRAVLAIIIIGIVSIAYYVPLYNNVEFEKPVFLDKHFFEASITELGAQYGFSIFTVILAFIGIGAWWVTRKQRFPSFLAILAGAIYCVLAYRSIGYVVNIHLNLVFSFLAGLGLSTIISRKWELRPVKYTTIALLFGGLLFSSYFFGLGLVDSQPSSQQIDSLLWLRQHADTESLVLSHYSKGFWIQAVAGMPVFMDSNLKLTPNVNDRYALSEQIFHATNIRDFKRLAGKIMPRYIWIDSQMKKGLVWEKDDEDLLFLFKDTETFKNIYRNDDVEIWEAYYGEEDMIFGAGGVDHR